MNAHQLCEDCKSKCDCGSQVGNRPNPLVHQILKDLPVYCQHYKTGCREMLMQVKDLEDHQMDCAFREVYCPAIGCQTCHGKIVFKDISDHFSESHDSVSWLNQEGRSIQSNVGLPFESKRWKMPPGNIEFFPVLWVSNGLLYSWIYILGSHFDAKNYAYTISMTGKNGYKSTIHENVRPLDDAAKDIIAEKAVFSIGIEFFKKLRGDKKESPIEVTIHALKEEVKDKDEESGVEDESD